MSEQRAGATIELVRTEVDGPVALMTFDRGDAANMLDRALMEGLVEALERFDRSPAVRCVLLAGGPRFFSTGADLAELEDSGVRSERRDSYLALWDRVAVFSKPLIAAVRGLAVGAGFELALTCDLIVASESAAFGFNELDLGIMPVAGGLQRLARSAGKHRALDLALTGRRWTAAEAQAFGLVCRVWPDETCLAQAWALARDVAARAPIAAAAAKASVLRAEEEGLAAARLHERLLLGSLFSTGDQKEGMKAFRDRRKPSFEGR